jgi:uncharacterized membrane protein HdeD (DUF308 family)
MGIFQIVSKREPTNSEKVISQQLLIKVILCLLYTFITFYELKQRLLCIINVRFLIKKEKIMV